MVLTLLPSWDVDRQCDLGLADQIEHPLRDVDRLVAYALQVGIDLDDGHDEAQVDRHGLLHGEQIERQLIDLALGLVDGGFTGKHHLTKLGIAGAIGFGSAIDGLLGKASHAQQFVPEFVQSLLKAASHYPNLPVM